MQYAKQQQNNSNKNKQKPVRGLFAYLCGLLRNNFNKSKKFIKWCIDGKNMWICGYNMCGCIHDLNGREQVTCTPTPLHTPQK